MKLKIKETQKWVNPADAKEHVAGAILELDDAKGKALVEAGIAEKVADAADMKALLDEAIAGLKDTITKSVAEAVKDAAKGFTLKGGRIEVGADRREHDPMGGFEDDTAYYKAVRKACTGGGIDERLKIIQEAGRKAGSLATGESGGFLAPVAMSERIFRRTVEDLNILGLTDRLVLDGFGGVRMAALKDDDRYTVATRHGGIIIYDVAEGAAITASDLKWREVTLMPHEKAALTAATDAMLQTIVNYGDRLNEQMGAAFADELVEWILFGGSGFVGAANAPCTLEIAKEADQEADSLVVRNIIKMEAFCDEAGGPGIFFYTPEAHTQLSLLTITVGTSGIPVMLPAGGLSAVPYQTIRGRRAIKSDHCEALGDAGDIILVNLSQYWLATSGDAKREASIHLYFDQAKTAFRGLLYACGQPYWEKTRRPRKGATDTRISPFVKVAARA